MLNSILTELVDYAEICPAEVGNPAVVILGTIFIILIVVVKGIFG